MSLISEIIASFFGEKSLSWMYEKRANQKKKKTIHEKFTAGLVGYCKTEGYQSEGIEPLFDAFISNQDNQRLVKKTLSFTPFEDKDCFKVLVARFELHTRNTFMPNFSCSSCIASAITACASLDSETTSAKKQTIDAIYASRDYIIKELNPDIKIGKDVNNKPRIIDCVPHYSQYFAFNDNCAALDKQMAGAKKVLITGAHGIGKTMLASKYIEWYNYNDCIWINCDNIWALNDCFERMFHVINCDKVGNNDIHDNISYFTNRIRQFSNPIIVFDHIEPQIDEGIMTVLSLLTCPIIVTSCVETLADFQPFCLELPPVEVCIDIYSQHLRDEYKDYASIVDIIRIAERHPQYIDLLARANAALRCSPDAFIDHLRDNQARILHQIEVNSSKDLYWKRATVAENIIQTFEARGEVTKDELDVLSVLYLLPAYPIDQLLIQNLLEAQLEKATVFSQLINRGMVYSVFVNKNICIELSSIARELITITSKYQSDIEERFSLNLIKFIDREADENLSSGIYHFNMICDICEYTFNRYHADNYDEIGLIFLYYKAKLYVQNARFRFAITECQRILELFLNISSLDWLEKNVRYLLANAYIEYGECEKAESILASIEKSINADDDFSAREFLKVAREHIYLVNPLENDYSRVYEELQSSLETADTVEKTYIYQRLATASYYQHLNHDNETEKYLKDALQFNEYAIELLKTHNMEFTEVSSFIYTAYSAALCDSGRLDEAITWGEKGLEASLLFFGNVSNHTITARNNYGNALMGNGRYFEALQQYQEILSVFPDVFTMNRMIIANAHAARALCELAIGHLERANELTKVILHEYRNDSALYEYVINMYIVMATAYTKKHDMDMLGTILGLIKPYVYSDGVYLNMKRHKTFLTRLEFAYMVGTKTFIVNSASAPDSRAMRNFKAISDYILSGFFDKNDSSLDEEHPNMTKSTIAVYSSMDSFTNDITLCNPHILIPRDRTTPPSADFGVQIHDNSMSPLIKYGDIVWAKHENKLSNKELGIFIDENQNLICRQYLNVETCSLKALDLHYPDIDISTEDRYKVIGLVVF